MRRNSGWQVYDDAGAKGEGEIGVGAVRAPVTSCAGQEHRLAYNVDRQTARL